jgi:hypothetical protein
MVAAPRRMAVVESMSDGRTTVEGGGMRVSDSVHTSKICTAAMIMPSTTEAHVRNNEHARALGIPSTNVNPTNGNSRVGREGEEYGRKGGEENKTDDSGVRIRTTMGAAKFLYHTNARTPDSENRTRVQIR